MIVPKPRRLKNGRYYIYLRLGDSGISITEDTERACTRSAQLAKAEYLAGKRLGPQKRSCTLSQAVDRYIDSRSSILSPATIRNYRGFQRTRFQSVMQENVWDCDERFWQAVVNREATTCSAKTLKNAWGVMSAAIYAETRQRFAILLPQIVRHEHEWLTPAQIDTFVAAIHGKSYEIPALLALCSLRRSEIKALRWQDVDLSRGIVHVRGSMVYNEDEKLMRLDTTKNIQSRRDVPMIPQLVTALQNTGTHAPLDPVVPLSYNAIFSGINRTCKAAGLPEVGIHGLRHSFASLAYHLGIPEMVAAQIGGWSDNATMHKIYTHIAQEDTLLAASTMQDFYAKMQTKT